MNAKKIMQKGAHGQKSPASEEMNVDLLCRIASSLVIAVQAHNMTPQSRLGEQVQWMGGSHVRSYLEKFELRYFNGLYKCRFL